MTLKNKQELESLKLGEIQALFDQLKFISYKLAVQQAQVDNVIASLNNKINAQSEYNEADVVRNIAGSGTITTNGLIVTGKSTLFTSEVSFDLSDTIKTYIKVGANKREIASVESDTQLTLVSSFPTNLTTDSFYGLELPVTKEVLSGDFRFGELNNPLKQFRGFLEQGSYFLHHGRIQDPYDLVNVKYVQRQVAPAMARALNAIQRDGDIIGLEGYTADKYEYLFRNCLMTIGDPLSANSELKYYGPTTDPNHVITRNVLEGYDNAVANSDFYARWQANRSQCPTAGGMSAVCCLPPKEQTDNLGMYFQISGNGLVYLGTDPIKILVTISAFTDVSSTKSSDGSAGHSLTARIINSKRNIEYAINQNGQSHSDEHGSSATIGCSASAVIRCVKDDIIVFGVTQEQPRKPEVYIKATLTRMR